MQEISLIPDAKNLMESTRSIGYSLPAAVADLIDNSIAAKARNIFVETPTLSDPNFTILDDGWGMTSKELTNAMKYGSRPVDDVRAESDLGRFGLGLKMASLSQCRSLTVVSKCKGQIVGARWDLDHVATASLDWSLQILDPQDLESVPGFDQLSELKHGTLVVWEKLDVMMQDVSSQNASNLLLNRASELVRHLSLVFHRYLEGVDAPKLNILFNGRELEPIDPFLSTVSTTPFSEDTYEISGEKITIQPYVLPHPKNLSFAQQQQAGDLQRDQGFYIYRNKRLVIWGTWFRLSRKLTLSKLARIRVDVPASPTLDRLWSLDVKKSSAVVPEVLKQSLRSVVEKLTGRSENVWKKRSRREQIPGSFWIRSKCPEGTVNYQINEENEIIRTLIEKYPELSSAFNLISMAIPLDTIYTDLSNEEVIDVIPQDNELIWKLRKAGLTEKLINVALEMTKSR